MKCDESFCMGAIIVLLIIVAFNTSDANAADYAIVSYDGYELYADTVSFDNPTDLIAKTKAVVGVCDTTWDISDTGIAGYSQYYFYADLQDSSSGDRHFIKTIITCRQLVGVTVTEEAGWREKLVSYELCPGEAIIFYEPYKEEQCIK